MEAIPQGPFPFPQNEARAVDDGRGLKPLGRIDIYTLQPGSCLLKYVYAA
jgi:hypothetical protein